MSPMFFTTIHALFQKPALFKNVRKDSSVCPYFWICAKSYWGLFWAKTHPPLKFGGKLLCSFCVILLTNQLTNGHGSNLFIVTTATWHDLILSFIKSFKLLNIRFFFSFFSELFLFQIYTVLISYTQATIGSRRLTPTVPKSVSTVITTPSHLLAITAL